MSSHNSPRRGGNNTEGRTPTRRNNDIESSPRPPVFASPTAAPGSGNRPRQSGYNSYAHAAPQHRPSDDRSPMIGSSQTPSERPHGGDVSRKKSLIKPERRRNDSDDPNYHYRKHAQRMAVQPSTTGHDPIMEDHEESADANSPFADQGNRLTRSSTSQSPPMKEKFHDVPLDKKEGGKLRRSHTQKELKRRQEREMRARDAASVRPPSLWNVYCAIVTFWCPDAVLRCFGKPQKAQQRAWREKMGLISIILLICTFVGYITFGFTQTVCPPGQSNRIRVNEVDKGFMIFHGNAIDLSHSHHPLARGIPDGANVCFDIPNDSGQLGWGGYDGSFLFQNVNGACKGLITKKAADLPSDGEDVAWYFPCRPFKQDGSSKPNDTQPVYEGYACHTSMDARKTFYDLHIFGNVYFTWDDVRNSSRELMVYGSDVLDLSLIDFINTTAVNVPEKFNEIRHNTALLGLDVTRSFSSASDKQVAKCLSQIIKVGSVDTTSVGCIASKVVLYVSLTFILSIVLAKFFLALAFQWVLSRKFAADKGVRSSKERQQQIEEWSDDIYRPPPKLTDPVASYADRSSKRGSMLFPTTSRFTSPYAIDRATGRPGYTTMASQSSTSKLLAVGGGMYKQGNQSQGTLPTGDARSSVVLDSEGPGPAGFIHEAVVPQPPPEWQPFGYPLAHVICLVTAYSEGHDGLRTTLDSIATTDYPNSHKLILVVADGVIKGKGETESTPDICLSMMKDHATLPQDVQPFSYVAVASGAKRHNMAKVYAGFYDYGSDSAVPLERQERVPMLLVVKCGTPDEASKSKPGNRGKRDSQIILMSFLQKVMFDERMTELEFEMFNGIWKVTGISPDFYEMVLMVDADTKVFPDSLTHMVSAMVKDPEIMGLCGETKIANKRESWVTMIQVFEYFISHHLSKSFESVFGGVTCLPGCFCMYRIKAPKGGQNYWVPILANPDVVEHYSENVVDTLHKKNLLLLGEDRYLSTLMLKTFPKRKQVFVPQAVCKTTVPDKFKVLLSQRRRWINSTVHNLMELVLVRDLCGTFCFSMQFVVFVELLGTLVLPAAISFTIYLVAISIRAAVEHTEAPVIPLILLALILGLPAVLIVLTAHRWSYVAWMFVYLLSLPIWNFVLPTYAYWKFDDFSWGDTRKTAGEKVKKAGYEYEGEFDSSKITMKRWGDFEQERRLKGATSTVNSWPTQQPGYEPYHDM
ncbi:uncharacterized protein PV09_04865 [Verruconis gallopava]|uniref:chitin synthase n=1 Tax=Verruconis gallopava TaxID=253628 RepID=A0A0D2AB89_9PEZI|nr:uncharacterized protein PV09_04865 [Verruconis gallopava]KIW04043.1 hypothetical protein PV09_04865 [Verruconis gallopava]